jgi:hypothetical protein
MDPYTEIKTAEDHLREIYKTNDGPRLIAEMVEREFPNPRRLITSSDSKRPGEWGPRATDTITGN